MRRKDMDLYIGVILVVIALLSLIGVFGWLGIGLSTKFFSILLSVVGIYLIIMGVKK